MLVPKKTSADSITVSDKRGMRVNGESYVAGERGHFDGEHALGDHLACAGADDAYAEHAFGLRIKDQASSCLRGGRWSRHGRRRPRETWQL